MSEFEPETKKFGWLLRQGYITPKELEFYSNFYEIQVTSVINYEGTDVLTPLFIIAKPSQFNNIKKGLSQAEIADPILKKFPVISLLSLEKFINSFVNLKIPYFFFSVWLHRSYNNVPREVHRFLQTLFQLANGSNKYVIKSYNILGEPVPLEEPIPLRNDLYKILCHYRKMLGERVECDDSDWWRYNLWGKSTTSTSTVDRKMIEKLALKYNVSPICLHYIIMYNKNPCHLSSDVISKIKSDLSSS